jgi:flagellar protein FliO/FliZ
MFQTMFFLLVFGSLLFMAVITTRFIGIKAQKAMKGRHITIIETVSLGLDKKIHLVKAGEQYILIASSGKTMEFLTTVTLNEAEPGTDMAESPVQDFRMLFDKYIQGFKSLKNGKNDVADNMTVGSEEEGTFRSNLDRLKKITEKADKIIRLDGDGITNEK